MMYDYLKKIDKFMALILFLSLFSPSCSPFNKNVDKLNKNSTMQDINEIRDVLISDPKKSD